MATQPDNVNSGALATMFALTALATVAAALGITALVRSEQGELGREREEPLSRAYRSLTAEQRMALTAPPTWTDRGAGLVSVPIDRAMELTLQDIRRGRTVVGARKPEEGEQEGEAADPEGEAPEEQTGDEGASEAAPSPEAPSPEGSRVPSGPAGTAPQNPTPSGDAPGSGPESGQDSLAPKAPVPPPARGPSGSNAPQQGAPSQKAPEADPQGSRSGGATQPQKGTGPQDSRGPQESTGQ